MRIIATTSDVVRCSGHGAEVGVHPHHPPQLQEGEQVDDVAAEEREDAAAHPGVAHPAVVRVQQTAARHADVHQVDVLADPALGHPVPHADDGGVEAEAVAQHRHQGGVVLARLHHAHALGLVEAPGRVAEDMLPDTQRLDRYLGVEAGRGADQDEANILPQHNVVHSCRVERNVER